MHVAVIKGRKAYVVFSTCEQARRVGGQWCINDEPLARVLVGHTSQMKGGVWYCDKNYHIAFNSKEEAVAYAKKYDDGNAQTTEEREAALREAGW
jgi:hypothetical protein